ncbi:cationic amino acid transporter 2 [Amyelois transitella]|uniref:cationic amino acid transporter 2 n=1 Tax=Amyelois transitella TaxID=680683 RepID=UPI00067BF09F|nr:cationic amino acid transporter 2 [Amyelois transitella]XP_013183271.1 cationic amino acid transporter 2 [Amyelois transitella]
MAGGTGLSKIINRKKVFDGGELQIGNLKRCLTQWDLTGLGVGSTLGVGTYVLIGYVALHLAGPSVVLSFLIAAVAALLAGLCYAELGSRVPRAGAAYIYTYTTIGELAAFCVGWNNILEGLFSTASIAKGLSLCVDSMTNHSLSDWFTSIAPISAGFFSPYFDLLAFCVVLLVGVLLAIGVKESTTVNNVLTALNMLVIGFIIIAGAVKADSGNWYIASADVPENYGSGGFFPYGVWGTLRGAAVCFYGFVGFDTIAAAGEETRNPRDNVPISILLTLVIAFFTYSSVAIVVTMMTPYYLQDTTSPVAGAFSQVGMDWAWWIVSIGTIFAISASLYGPLFPLPRLLYAMSSDGLFIRFFQRVSKRDSPVIATLASSAVIAVLSSVMELDQMLMMLCIGTLLSYTSVAVCVLLLRYRSDDPFIKSSKLSIIFGCGLKEPSKFTTRVIIYALLLFICVCLSSALVLLYAKNALIPVLVLHLVALIIIFVMCCQPKIVEDFASKTPLVPLIPCLSIYVNIHLMTLINIQTWIRVFVWMLIGIPVYIICVCCKKDTNNLEGNMKTFVHVNKNGKAPVQIVVESPTPPSSKRINDFGAFVGNPDEMQEIKSDDLDEISEEVDEKPAIKEEIIVHHAIYENSEEKEAKIIDLLDQVLQAEEDRYGEELKDVDETNIDNTDDTVVHRKSLSELSDAGSDASFGNQVLSKYDVIAQVHREDLTIVSEEEERHDIVDDNKENIEMEEYEQVTAFNDSETNSRTDESGYSDTILDKTGLNDSAENVKEDAPYIPPPPPLDEEYFARPTFHKFYSMPKVPSKASITPSIIPDEERQPPRESLQSNSSHGDGTIVFGSDRQIHFMSKLSNIYANKLNPNDEQEQRKRSHSTGNVAEGTDLGVASRPLIFKDLNKEFLEKKGMDLRPVKLEEEKGTESNEPLTEDGEDLSMTRDELKSKLTTIFASGGTKLVKPRLMKSNPPTPEDAYQTETSSTDSIPKITKENKNDTLSRQRAKFGEVLNSFRLSFNNDDLV